MTTLTQPDPDGAGSLTAPVTTYAYDAASRNTSITDPLARVTAYAYSHVGYVTSITQPDPDGAGSLTSPVTSFVYNALGSVTSQTDPLGKATTYVYDNLQRPTSVTQPDPDGAGSLAAPVTAYTYNVGGMLAKITDPLLRDTTFGYDTYGRRTTVTDHQSNVTTTAYDTYNRVTSVTAPNPGSGAPVTTYAYDRLNRLTKETDSNSGETEFTHDAVGNLLTLTDPVENTTAWTYDGLNRQLTETNQLTKTRTFVYDAASNLTKLTDRLGRIVEYAYDNLDRNTSEIWKNGTTTVRTISFAFDTASQLTSASDPDSSYAHTYDALGRVLTVSNSGTSGVPTVVLTSAYDARNSRTSLAATRGGTADFLNTYTYDALARLTRVDQTGQTGGATVADKRVDFEYNAVDQFTKIIRNNKVSGTWTEVATSTFTFDTLNRLTALDHKRGATNIANYAWTFDTLSRVTRFTSPDGTSDYTYDSTSQLTASDHSYQTDETNTYDANGNRTNGSYTTGANNQLTSDGIYNYTYDDEGNRLTRTKISNSSLTEYTWDHRNRLTKVVERATGTGGAITKQSEYTYDVFNRRIAKSVDADGAGGGSAVVARYVYDGDNIALQFDGSSTLTHRYLHGPAIDQILADEDASNNILWPLADNLGTIRDLINNSGTVQNHIKYDSFGQVTAESNAAVDHIYAFTGRERDEETGLQYHRRRYYDPAAGRWTSEDPIEFAAGDTSLSAGT